MKKVIAFLFCFSAICVSVSAQSLSYELNKIREIKLLESTRDDVKRILSEYKSDKENTDERGFSETFSFKKIEVEVTYTTGDCSDDADDTDEWNVKKGKVKSIEISFSDPIKFEDLQLNAVDFLKEQKLANREDDFVYHDKDKGISLFVNEEKIQSIYLFPVKKQKSLLCKNEEATMFREFYSTESYFGNTKLEDRVEIACVPAAVSDLILDATEITASCSAVDSKQNKNCSTSSRIILVSTKPNDSGNDVLTYAYTVSGGIIVGAGKDVIWDLSDVKPGKYTITAAVDDGCGFCGETKTKTVIVK